MNRLLLLLFVISTYAGADQQLLSGEQSSQFISYWKSHVITAEQDDRIKFAESVYHRLLRAWDSSRLEPGLFVVDSQSGPWAASLVDGNILLSIQALDTINSFGARRAEHLLAFVLAHELAHQRSDDLWQHRFFNLDHQQQQSIELQLDRRVLAEMEEKEARADHDGLVLMSSVGFNPYLVVGKKDFFTEWVENIWKQPCDQQQDSVISNACQQAKARALRTYSKLDLIVSQSSLYELGVQALVAANYTKARYYFTQYGRDFPNRAVMSALGLSYLAEAIELGKKLNQQGVLHSTGFYYPLLLDATAGIEPRNPDIMKRTAVDQYAQKQKKKINQLVDQALSYYEKAIKLQPEYKNSYLALASAYLIKENQFMVRGVLQGRYQPRFGKDPCSEMLLALTTALEGNTEKAIDSLKAILKASFSNTSKDEMQTDLLQYSVIFNLTELLNSQEMAMEAKQQWKQFARSAQKKGDAHLFRLALAHLENKKTETKSVLKHSPNINGLRPGNKKTRDDSGHTLNELWIEGEQFYVYNYNNGAQFITGIDGKIISASQQAGKVSIENLFKPGDDAKRLIKTLGVPSRRINLVAGEYLAYDQYGFALKVDENEIKGWFLYQ